MTGCGNRRMESIMALQICMMCWVSPRPPSASLRCAVSSLRSWPAEKTGPRAASTTARTAFSSAMSARARCKACSVASASVLRARGRLRIKTAMSPEFSRRTGEPTTVVSGAVRTGEAELIAEFRERAAGALSPAYVGAPRPRVNDTSDDPGRSRTRFCHLLIIGLHHQAAEFRHGWEGGELGFKPAQAPPEHRLVAVDYRLAERALDLGNRFHLGGGGAAEKNSVGVRPVVLARELGPLRRRDPGEFELLQGARHGGRD